MERQIFFEQLRSFLRDRARVPVAEIGPDTSLVRSGLLDSMLITELVLFVESITGRPVDIDDFQLSRFDTMQQIWTQCAGAAEERP